MIMDEFIKPLALELGFVSGKSGEFLRSDGELQFRISPDLCIVRYEGLIQIFAGVSSRSFAQYMRRLPQFASQHEEYAGCLNCPATGLPPPCENVSWIINRDTNPQVLGEDIRRCLAERIPSFIRRYANFDDILDTWCKGGLGFYYPEYFVPIGLQMRGRADEAQIWLGEKMESVKQEYARTKRPRARERLAELSELAQSLQAIHDSQSGDGRSASPTEAHRRATP